MTKEPTRQLRARLHVLLPSQSLLNLLDGRATRTRDDNTRNWFEQVRDNLLSAQAESSNASPDSTPDISWGVACDVCGMYFLNHRTMRSHRARKHKPAQAATSTSQSGSSAAQVSGVLAAPEYSRSSADGMPTCGSVVLTSFTRVEGLKKHINRGCPKLAVTASALPSPSETTADPSVKVASDREEPSGQGPAPQVVSASGNTHKPLIEDQDFRSKALESWKHTLLDEKYCQSLRTYCTLCGQWVSLVGPGCKQHHRLMHGREFQQAPDAISRITSLGLVPRARAATARRSARTHPRQHLKACVPVYQASLAALLIQAQVRRSQHGDGSGGDGRGDVKSLLRAQLQDGSPGPRTRLQPQRSRHRSRRSKRRRTWTGRRKGPSGNGWGGGGWRSQKRGWEQQHQRSQETATVASLDPTLQKLLTTLTRAVLRHEPDLTLDTSPRSFLLQKLQEAGENGTTGWICTAKGRSRDR